MEPEKFKELVRSMRTAQKDFFFSKSKEMLRKAKRLESQVDEALNEQEPEKSKYNQQSLDL